jgi:peptidoglycan L-alanyl-D-glutamate endopeptidase CwlK
MFTLSEQSERRLVGVHADLVAVVRRAIQVTTQDFRVIEGVRTRERQTHLVASGASRTLNSRHITGHAVDLAPLVRGQVSWDWRYFHLIALAMQTAAAELAIPVRWGGAWRLLADLTPDAQGRFPLAKRFPDGPHYELPKGR